MIQNAGGMAGRNLDSVVLYLLFFITAIACCSIADCMYNMKNRIMGDASAIVAIFILCGLAAMRDISVGGDIQVYLLNNFNRAESGIEFNEFLKLAMQQIEPLFAILIYACAKVKSLKLLFFMIEFLALFPIFLSLRKRKASITLGITIYVFLFYNFSLSGMRQSIAMSIMMLAFCYLDNKKYFWYAILCVVAFLFHKGAVFVIIVTVGLSILERKQYHLYKKYICQLGILLGVFFVTYNRLALTLASLLWKIEPRYSFYIRTYVSNVIQVENIPTTELVFKFGIVGVCLWYLYYNKRLDNKKLTIVTLVCLGRYFVLLNSRFYESLRVAYYFDIFELLLVSDTLNSVKKIDNKVILSGLIVALAVGYWLYFIMHIGGYGTNVYTFG